MGFGHALGQFVRGEEPGFQDFPAVQGEAVEPAGQGGLVVRLDAVPVSAADHQQPSWLDGQPGLLTDFAGSDQVVLVAHNAPTEASVLYDYRSACPHLAAAGFLDTVRLARLAYPKPTAVYQSVLMHPGDDAAALEQARRILQLAGQ